MNYYCYEWCNRDSPKLTNFFSTSTPINRFCLPFTVLIIDWFWMNRRINLPEGKPREIVILLIIQRIRLLSLIKILSSLLKLIWVRIRQERWIIVILAIRISHNHLTTVNSVHLYNLIICICYLFVWEVIHGFSKTFTWF